jgi:hypothetical protein
MDDEPIDDLDEDDEDVPNPPYDPPYAPPYGTTWAEWQGA